MALAAGGCAWLEGGSVAERSVLARRLERLRALVQDAEHGPLFRQDQLVLAVDQRLVQSALAATLPWETLVGGRYRVQVQALECQFQDGLPLLRLDSHVSAPGQLGERDFAELRLYADLGLTGLDPQVGRVEGQLALLAFDVRRLEPVGDNAMVLRMVEELGRLKLEAFVGLARSFQVPLRFEHQVRIAASAPEKPLQLPAGRVRLGASAATVRAFGGRLWLGLDATPGEWSEGEPAAEAP